MLMLVSESKIKWQKFISGDNDAYSWLYTVYVQKLFQYGLRFTSNTEIVKDSIQEVFIQLYKSREHLTVPENVSLYLFVSLKNNLIRTLYKEAAYDSFDPEIVRFSLDIPTVEEQYIDNEQYANQRKEVKKILSLLTPRQKEIIYYRYIQELSMDEICVLMNLNYQSAENLIQRSLKKVRKSYVSVELFLLILSVY